MSFLLQFHLWQKRVEVATYNSDRGYAIPARGVVVCNDVALRLVASKGGGRKKIAARGGGHAIASVTEATLDDYEEGLRTNSEAPKTLRFYYSGGDALSAKLYPLGRLVALRCEKNLGEGIGEVQVALSDGIPFRSKAFVRMKKSLPFLLSIFSEFPKTCRAKEFFDLLKEHGCLKEVVIPPKRNALGKIFGFARFSDAEDQRILATRMDFIFIGKNKIHANLPKFQRKKVASRVGSGESLFGGSGMRGSRGVAPISNMLYGRRVGVKSFADVLGVCNGVNPPKPFLSFVPEVEVIQR
ncbi:hypothetical protein KIW84_033919 [Lathyrus oleraceus]|uniref:RRM domain-containing protein n=1 Tax=Pisum sativum TaxID=3888 RepID=A0A9D4Y234_PEA|nr:hypothetical protein KIW84_033919 [Pisum sativum]